MKQTQKNGEVELRYAVNDVPPWYLSCLLGFQHYLTMLGSTVLIPLLLVPAMGGNSFDTARVINTISPFHLSFAWMFVCCIRMFFVSGLNTLVQTTFGDRLPIIQGGSFSYLPPAFAVIGKMAQQSFASEHDRFIATMQALQGSIILASFVQMFLGYSGLMSLLLKCVSPVTTASVGEDNILHHVAYLAEAALPFALLILTCGPIEVGVVQILLVILFSQYLSKISIPMGKLGRVRVFQLFPVVLAIVICWIYAAILTESGVYDSEPTSACRTDNTAILGSAPWFYFPYPIQWGTPTFDVGNWLAMLAGLLLFISNCMTALKSFSTMMT
eukprot:scaffold212234_cov33-Prasinocladus_malaysianus.AAC.1